MLDALPRLGQCAVAAALRRQIHDHAAGGHAFHHCGSHDRRRRSPRYRSGADHHIHTTQVVGQAALLLGTLFIGQRARVTALARRAHPEVEKARAQRLDLLAGFRAHVEAFHLRTKTPGSGNGLQARHARTDHQHLGRSHGAGSSGQHREETGRAFGRDQRRLVAGHAGLRTEHVHRLRAGGARQLLQREQLQAVASGQCRKRRITGRGQQANHAGSGLELLQDQRRRRLHAQQDIDLAPTARVEHTCAGIVIGRIGEACGQAGAGLVPDGNAEGTELARGFRRQRHAPFARRGLLDPQQRHGHAGPR